MKRLIPLVLLCALGCRHVVTGRALDPDGSNPVEISFDVPKVEYVAANGHRIVEVIVDGATLYRLDIDGKVGFRRKKGSISFEKIPWDEARAALGLGR